MIYTKIDALKQQAAALGRKLPKHFNDHETYRQILKDIASIQAQIKELQHQASLGAPSLRHKR
jgi:hypothetical protein